MELSQCGAILPFCSPKGHSLFRDFEKWGSLSSGFCQRMCFLRWFLPLWEEEDRNELVHPGTSTYCFGSVISIFPPGLSMAATLLSLYIPSEYPWPSWNSLVLLGLFVSLESLVLCLLESLGFQRRGSLPEKKKKYNCLVCCCILVVVVEEIFKSPIKGLI